MERGSGRLELELWNPSGRTPHRVEARVYLPVGATRPRLRPDGWLTPRARVRLAPDRSWLALTIPELAAGVRARYTIRYGAPLVTGSSSPAGSRAGSEQTLPRQM